MFHTIEQLRAAIEQLEQKRREHHTCDALRQDTKRQTKRKFQVRHGVFEEVTYGIHGTDYLGIDLDTGEVACAACKGSVDATVKEGA